MFSNGFVAFAILPASIAFMSAFAFPHEKYWESAPVKKHWNILYALRYLATVFFMLWLASLDSFNLVIDEVFSGSTLCDWRLITAVFIGHIHWGYSSYKKASALNDKDIIDIYE